MSSTRSAPSTRAAGERLLHHPQTNDAGACGQGRGRAVSPTMDHTPPLGRTCRLRRLEEAGLDSNTRPCVPTRGHGLEGCLPERILPFLPRWSRSPSKKCANAPLNWQPTCVPATAATSLCFLAPTKRLGQLQSKTHLNQYTSLGGPVRSMDHSTAARRSVPFTFSSVASLCTEEETHV